MVKVLYNYELLETYDTRDTDTYVAKTTLLSSAIRYCAPSTERALASRKKCV